MKFSSFHFRVYNICDSTEKMAQSESHNKALYAKMIADVVLSPMFEKVIDLIRLSDIHKLPRNLVTIQNIHSKPY